MCLTTHDELERSLQKLLFVLKKNREQVDREVLKTYYNKPYYELLSRINQAATAYVKKIAVSRLLLNPDVALEEQIAVINQAIVDSGLLKEMGRSISRHYDTALLRQMALELRTVIEDALEPYIARKNCLVVDLSDTEKEPIIYNTLTKCIYENEHWSYQALDLYGKLLVFIKPENTIAGNAPAESEERTYGKYLL